MSSLASSVLERLPAPLSSDTFSLLRTGIFDAPNVSFYLYLPSQRPFNYTGRSPSRLLQGNGFEVLQAIAYQRYSLENHLGWVRHGTPGGDAAPAAVFSSIADDYRAALEAIGTSDTVVVLSQVV